MMCDIMSKPIAPISAPQKRRERKDCELLIGSSDPITQSTYSFDSRSSEFPPQSCDEDFDGVRIAIESLRVDVLRQLALRNHSSRVMHQVREHTKLMARQ